MKYVEDFEKQIKIYRKQHKNDNTSIDNNTTNPTLTLTPEQILAKKDGEISLAKKDGEISLAKEKIEELKKDGASSTDIEQAQADLKKLEGEKAVLEGKTTVVPNNNTVPELHSTNPEKQEQSTNLGQVGFLPNSEEFIKNDENEGKKLAIA